MEESGGIQVRHRHAKQEESQEFKGIFRIRQILNTLFILLALVGVGIYSYGVWYIRDTRIELMGTIVIVVAVVIKMAESVLRYFKR